MFKNLSNKFDDIKRKFFSAGKINEKNIQEGIAQIKEALLNADVNFKVVKQLIERIKQKAIGEELIKSVTPSQLFIKIVQDELAALMGEPDHTIKTHANRPTVIMMVGLQGSGKTTTCGKLAKYLIKKGHRPFLVAADTQRPGAIEQLHILGEQIGEQITKETGSEYIVPVYSSREDPPPKICKDALPLAKEKKCDIVILDTAGRLHIDTELMKELQLIKKQTKPDHVYFIMDSMTGQNAVDSARSFNEEINIDGVILTKLDSDAKGGAALSIKEVTGKPINFVGVGEKLNALKEFHPKRMASRITGMGDIDDLVIAAQEAINEEEAEKMHKKILEATFTMQDLLGQFQMIKKMGSLRDLMGMLPGGLGVQMQNADIDESIFTRIESMIHSMTPQEREIPDIIDGSRRARIAKGSGTTIQDINQLLQQFRQMRKMMKSMSKGGGMFDGLMSKMGMGGMGGMGALADEFGGMENMGFAPKGSTSSARKKKRKKKSKK